MPFPLGNGEGTSGGSNKISRICRNEIVTLRGGYHGNCHSELSKKG